jgi:hypothetical protein
MNEKKILLIFFLFFFSFLINILLLRTFVRRILFLEISIFSLIFLFFLINFNFNFWEFIYVFILYLSLYSVYAFTIIMPLDVSPSLKIIVIIYNSQKIKKKALLKKFLVNSFIKDRLNKLIKYKYINFNNNYVSLNKKFFFLLKFFIKIRNLQNFKKNTNG